MGTGSYAPVRVVPNAELSTMLDTSDQWIWDRTGIRERRVARPDESNACMAKAAAERAMQASGVTPLDLDTIVVATCTPIGCSRLRPAISRRCSAPQMPPHSMSPPRVPGSCMASMWRKASSPRSRPGPF